MHTCVYLTDAERAIWRTLKPELQEGWTVEPENGNFRDSPDRRRTRLHLVKLEDPKFVDFLEKAKKASTVDALAALILATDLHKPNYADHTKLFSAIGPGPMGRAVESLLSTVTRDEDIEKVAALTTLRRFLYETMHS